MKLLAISGGPDSMFLLNEYKRQKIFVAHVNYHFRKDSNNDQKIVENFCNEHNIPYRVLDVKEKHQGNQEKWARDIRYNFFQKIYQEINAKALLVAHHKDDFLETALMQQESGRLPKYFGINKKIDIFNMHVIRPFIDVYWKDEILDELNKKGINYALDSTNKDEQFTRNKIRLKIKEFSKKEKQSHYSWFVMSNRILKKKWKRITNEYQKWEKSNFDTLLFQKFYRDQQELIFTYIHKNFKDINLSSKKMLSIIDFIKSKEGGKIFKLNNKFGLTKKSNHLIKINI